MGNSQLLKNVLRKRAAAAGAAPFTPNLTGEGFNTVKTPGLNPADAPAPTPMNQVKNFGANALNQGKNMFGAAENEVAQAKPMVEAAGAAVKPYFNGLGSNPGQWAAGHPIGTLAAGAGAAYLLYKLLHKKQQPQVDGQPKMAGEKQEELHPTRNVLAKTIGSYLVGGIPGAIGSGLGLTAGSDEATHGKDEYTKQHAREASSFGSGMKAGLPTLGGGLVGGLAGGALGSSLGAPGMMLGANLGSLVGGGLGSIGSYFYGKHIGRTNAQEDLQHKKTAGEFMPGHGPHLTKVTPPPAVSTMSDVPIQVDKALAGTRGHVGDSIADVIPQVAASAKSPTPVEPGADAPVVSAPQPAARPAAPGVLDQLTGAAKTLGTQAQGFNAEHPAAKYIAGGAAALSAAALLAHLLNKPSKKDQAGHIAPAAPAVA